MNREPKVSALGQHKGMGWGGRWVGVHDGGVTCVPVADSHQCMAKIITIL